MESLNKRLFYLVLLGLTLLLLGCVGSSVKTGSDSSSYAVSGIVVDQNGSPIEDVTLSFGEFGIAITDPQGRWSKSGLKGSVVIEPAKDGWTFTPRSVTVDGPNNDIKFVGNVVDASPSDAEVVIVEALVDPNPRWPESMYHDRVQLTLKNLGGPGFFKVQFWGTRPNVPNPSLELFGETEVYEVGAGWSGTAAWDVWTPSTSITYTYIREVVVLTRNPEQLTYRETSRVEPTLVDNL